MVQSPLPSYPPYEFLARKLRCSKLSRAAESASLPRSLIESSPWNCSRSSKAARSITSVLIACLCIRKFISRYSNLLDFWSRPESPISFLFSVALKVSQDQRISDFPWEGLSGKSQESGGSERRVSRTGSLEVFFRTRRIRPRHAGRHVCRSDYLAVSTRPKS
jgi:hypothetical protein